MIMSYRTRAKGIKQMFRYLEEMMGQKKAGMFMAICCDLLAECCKDVNHGALRTLEITINDCFLNKYDFEKEQLIEK